jgi:Ni,Fe-hydrogenase III small subunit/NAD-dependent dihydropyrimidine dehydrogenase PreA subunit
MPFWTLSGLRRGNASTTWGIRDGDDGQEGVLGMPRFTPSSCDTSCSVCAEICPTMAITATPSQSEPLALDYGKCVTCQLCVEACPTGALTRSHDWAFGVRSRGDLQWLANRPDDEAPHRTPAGFYRSLHVRHVDAGSCNACESELQALNNPFYNLHRLGVFFTASPRFADLLLVTGPVTHAMRGPLLATYEAMPEPRWVMAIGTCAVAGGTAAGGEFCASGLEGILPVDIYLPGCPPNPAAMIEAFMLLLARKRQRVKGGHYGD